MLAFLPAAVRSAETGEDVFRANCAKCHALPDPAKLTEDQWVLRLKDMAANAGLNKEQKSEVLGYLQSHSKKAVQIVAIADERRTFEEKCSLCHNLDRIFLEPLTPESRRHIILRMKERAPEGWITENDVNEIVEYLAYGAPEAKRPQRKEIQGQPAQVFRERCSACHTLERVYLALEESLGKDKAPPWMHIVQRMREKAPEWISAQEAEQIMTYLQSLKPVKNGASPEGLERR